MPDGLELAWDGTSTAYPRRVGSVRAMFDPEADEERRANDERALDTVRALGCTLHDVTLPDGDLSYFIEYIERAADFDSFTRAGVMLSGQLYRDGETPRICAGRRACGRAIQPDATRI